MRIGRWWFRVGYRIGIPGIWFNGIGYPPVLVDVRGGKAWLGKGVEVMVGPWCMRIMHVLYGVSMDLGA